MEGNIHDNHTTLISFHSDHAGIFELSVNGGPIALVAESVGSVQACVELTSGILPSDITVSLETMDSSAIGNI